MACNAAVGSAPHPAAEHVCRGFVKLPSPCRSRIGLTARPHTQQPRSNLLCSCAQDSQVVTPTSSQQEQFMHTLPCGLRLEVLHEAAAECHVRRTAHIPPLLFLHGAAHGAWCWQENFMPYFAAHGVESYALSLRGHGNSDPVKTGSCSMTDQLDDISSFIGSLRQPPVLVGHSIGGFITQRYLERLSHSADWPAVAAAALLANSGPRKSMPTLHWFQAQRNLWHVARVFLWMLKRPVHDGALVREMFFSKDLPEEHFKRYHKHLKEASAALPITSADMQQKVQLGPLPLPPVLALCGSEDGIVMPYQLRDAADFFGGKAVLVPGVAHDVMLDTRWELVAKTLLDWVLEVSMQASLS